MKEQPERIVGVHAGRATPRPTRVSQPREPCQADGCERTTNGGKDYCVKHLHLMPYVKDLLAKKKKKKLGPDWR